MKNSTAASEVIPAKIPRVKKYPVDLTGMDFGRWTVLRKFVKAKHGWRYECRCDCGTVKIVYGSSLKSGDTISCGCWKSDGWEFRNGTPQLIGEKFGRWTVTARDTSKPGTIYWIAKCDCGVERTVLRHDLEYGKSVSCGCYNRELLEVAATTHGATRKGEKSGAYTTWCAMKTRVSNENQPGYPNYGGRGIKVCERWKGSFEEFFADMGDRPEGLSIERINNEGNYSCGKCEQCLREGWVANCKWATQLEQMRNTRRTNGTLREPFRER